MDSRSGRRLRIVELDILRGLAFFAVVFQHTVGIYIRKPDVGPIEAQVMGLLFNLSKFAVPMFVFITGIVLFYNYYENLDYRRFISRRVTEILVPYALWTVIYNYFYFRSITFDAVWLKTIVKSLLSGEGAYHLWYIVMIFQFYLFFPLIRQVFKIIGKTITRHSLLILAAVGLGYIVLMWAAGEHSSIFGTKGLIRNLFVSYRSRNALYYIFYFVLGAFAGLNIHWWRNLSAKYQKPVLFLFVIFFVWVGAQLLSGEKINLSISTTLKTSMFLYTITQIVLLYNISVLITERYPRVFSVISFVGKYSLGAYLMHALTLDYTVRALYKFIPTTHYLVPNLLAFMICSAVSVALAKLIGMIPFGFLLTGSGR
ncbi:MAG TPA: acyltransferase [Desulfobacteria bacterium]|nr:acyltransferase [Desulfobacteria bacterium]